MYVLTVKALPSVKDLPEVLSLDFEIGIQIKTAQRTKYKMLHSVYECCSSLQAKLFKRNAHVCALSTLHVYGLNTGQSKAVAVNMSTLP